MSDRPAKVDLLAKAAAWFHKDMPPELREKLEKIKRQARR